MTSNARLKSLSAVFALLAAVLLTGCFFDTRNPEAPSGGGSAWQLPTTPDLVVTNLANAYAARNLTNHLRSFSDDFAFQADPRDTLVGPRGRYANWDRDVESQVTGALFNLGPVALSFTNPQGSTGETTADRYQDYELRISGTTPIYARGRAHFLLRKDAEGFWAIHRWEDIKTDTTDWGQVKGNYR